MKFDPKTQVRNMGKITSDLAHPLHGPYGRAYPELMWTTHMHQHSLSWVDRLQCYLGILAPVEQLSTILHKAVYVCEIIGRAKLLIDYLFN